MVTLSILYKIQPVAIMWEIEETLELVAAESLILKVQPPKIHISDVFFSLHSPFCFCTTPDPILITSHSKDITMAKSRKCIWAAGKRPLQRQAAVICRDSRGGRLKI